MFKSNNLKTLAPFLFNTEIFEIDVLNLKKIYTLDFLREDLPQINHFFQIF